MNRGFDIRTQELPISEVEQTMPLLSEKVVTESLDPYAAHGTVILHSGSENQNKR